ncbi:aldehyde dehydrogenase family protein [Herbiconiux daphne]|uniref:Aldehyde dehydrogenase family protein n=1 Tax=Herbiconiux daphne TaxID=2970914 RepID=A0ABT2H734_9MICO|nr:aldehyde dehydrogenase family protein [Herbiconiux daphne]MCS5735741.1 aldehyde dehydrogenase family protein [Herbiconiux daphne]
MSTSSYAPRDGSVVATAEDTSADEVLARVDAATRVAALAAESSPAERRRWLDAIAKAVEDHRGELVEIADRETALGATRLRAEVARMADQLRFYGRVAIEGGYLGVAIDDATDTAPQLVRVNRPLGPVAVFGSSNFPFGFGVLGTDTGSAIAAGCPVVAKAHSAHLSTCLRLAEIARDALEAVGAPRDILSIIVGRQAGADLVAAAGIKAVGFTGSQAVGVKLWHIANQREEVVPVYAEMGTVNPAVVTRAGIDRIDEIARGFVGSFTLGAGQFCTKPGVLFAPAGRGVAEAVAESLRAAAPEPTMLTKAIAADVLSGLDEMVAAGARVVVRLPGSGAGWSADSAVLSAPINALMPGSRLLEECFGPVALVVEYATDHELTEGIRSLQGSLAAAVFGADADDPDLAHVVQVLSGQVGRVTVGDWPTGVAWTWAQQHGGPWPATSRPESTSVGAAALSRFVRPVTFQSVPNAALPPTERAATAPENPWKISRRVNGEMVSP